MNKNFLLITSTFLFSVFTRAELPLNTNRVTSTEVAFTANRGQVHDQFHKARPDILYGTRNGDMSVHIRNTGVSYQIYRADKFREVENRRKNEKHLEPEQQTIYRVDLNWVTCNTNFTTKEDEVLPGYENFYLENCPGALNVRSYTGVTLINIYNGIDVHYYGNNGNVKHDYIVAPHADYRQIRLEVKGADISMQPDGSVIFSTALGKIQEGAPIVFQAGRQLRSKWRVEGQVLSFEIQNYDPALELVIDPITRMWSTYYGGSGSLDYPSTCITDATGNVYSCGETDSNSGTAIATTGSHQTTFGGGTKDAFLAKFDALGNRLWSTYYGGSAQDDGFSCATDASGDVYLTGSTTSTAGIATPGSHQPAYASANLGYDAFLVKFTPAGVRIWGTYYGMYCQANALATDASGNVYLAGEASSGTTGSFVTTPGAHQLFSNGSWDGFLAKFDSNGNRLWGTYYGGTDIDQIHACATDASGNIFVAGRSKSSASGTMISTPGSHQTAFGGNTNMYDAFLVKFDPAGVRQWATFYGGTGNEFGYSCAADANGNVFLAGVSDSNTGGGTIIATPGSFQQTYTGSFYVFSGFLAKFDAGGVRQWGTYYGWGSSSDNIRSCATDAIGNVYVAGTLGTGSGTVFATPGSHQVNNAGLSDGFLAKFDPNGIRISSTYYGGTNHDRGISCAVSPVGFVYLLGSATSTNGIVFSNGITFKNTMTGVNDCFLARFETCDAAPLTPPSVTGPATVCAGSAATFTSAPAFGATYYSWSFPGGSSGANLSNTISLTLVTSGTVSVIAGNPCGVSQQQTLSVQVNSVPVVTANSGSICAGQSFTIVPGGALSYSYSGGSAVVSPAATTVYTVTGINAAGCSNKAYSSVAVSPLPTVSVNSGMILCVGQSFMLLPSGAHSYTFSGGSAFVSPTVSTSYSVTGASAAGCLSSNTAVVHLTVSATPIPTIQVNSGAVCLGQSFTIIPSGANSYTISGGNFVVSPTANSSYTINGTSAAGCRNSNPAVSVVTVKQLPVVTVTTDPSGVICAGEAVLLTASGANAYTFSPGGAGNALNLSPAVTTTYVVTGQSADGCYNSAQVVQEVNECAGFYAPGSSLHVTVFPNPSHDHVNIDLPAASEIKILDAFGRIVHSSRREAGLHQISLEHLSSGVYTVRIGGNGEARNYKLVRD